MLEKVDAVNSVINNFIWGVPAMICIIGVGLYLSFRTRFLQIRKFPYAMKVTFGRMFKKKEAGDGALTPFQAVCTALAATVGTGNVAGVAGAIAIGGPGAIFWMWISALLGMCTKFAEVTLAVHFREKNKDGDYVGGPMYYIKNGLKKHWQWLAYLFSAFGVLTVFGTGNATQVNTITTAIDSALFNYNVISENQVSTLNLIIGIVLAILIALILLGGIKRIGQVTEKLVPFMAVMYIVLAIGVVLLNVKNVPTVFASIFEGAFNPASVTGGVVGSFFMSMKKGVSRGIFSNEAGLGTGSIAHACADTRKPVKQGFFGIFEVFVDTIVICTLTALVILCSGVPIGYGQAAGAELTISGFTATYGGWVSIFTAIAMCCFAFSTIIGWGLYGVRCIEFLFGTRVNKPFMLVYSLVAIVGATVNLGLLLELGAPEQLAKRAAADAAAENGFAGAAGSGQNPGFGSDNGQTAAKKKHTAAGITLAVITSPIWASLLLAVVCVLFAVVITVAAVVLSLGFAAAVMVAAGLFTVGTALVTVFLHIPTAVMLIGAGLVSVGLGLLAALLTYGCVIGIKRFVMWISNKEWRNAKIHKSKIFA